MGKVFSKERSTTSQTPPPSTRSNVPPALNRQETIVADNPVPEFSGAMPSNMASVPAVKQKRRRRR